MAQDAQEEQGLLEYIGAHVDDDAPRLVYADWLEEHDLGDGKRAARAELIRVQCALTDPQIDAAKIRRLQERQERLLQEHRAEWERPLRRAAQVTGVVFERGFPRSVTIPVSDFLSDARELFATAPTVRHACLTRCYYQDWMQRLARSRYLGRLRDLKLEGVDTPGVRTLVSSRHIADLRSLDLSHDTTDVTHIDAEGARALASSSHLRNLTALNLHGNDIGCTGARVLAESAALARLESLDVSDNNIGADGALALASSPHLGHLVTLNLGGNRIEPRGVEALADSATLANLLSLGLSDNGLRSGIWTLAESAHLQRLRSLDLSGNGLSDVEVDAFAAGSNLGSLAALNLSHNRVGPAGVRTLAASPALTNLRSLDLSHNNVSADAARALASSPYLRQLVALNLSYNRRGEERYEGRPALEALRGSVVRGRGR